MKNDIMAQVEKIMREHPEAKDDDFKLYGWACKESDARVMQLTFTQVLWNASKLNIPSYESVTRARRKLQELHPELRGVAYNKRMKKQSEYKNNYGRRYS